MLGACIGEALAGRSLGRKAMVYGIIAQSLPDIDFVTSFYLNKPQELLAHRGFTHSILFALTLSVLAAIAAHAAYKRYVPLRKWIILFGVNIFTHIFIDAFNVYGTAWFEPFSHHRVSFNALYVADPFLTVVPFVAAMALFFLHRRHNRREVWAGIGVGYVVIYLTYACINKWIVLQDVGTSLEKKGISGSDFILTPAPLNTWLWYVVAKSDSGALVGYRSVFDTGEETDLQYFARNNQLLQPIADQESLLYLKRFSQGFYTVEQWDDTTVFNDLRFGQIVGWHNPRERFVFHYYLTQSDKNDLVVQRGRFAKWDAATFKALISRIKGN